jgi:hypothetical protein
VGCLFIIINLLSDRNSRARIHHLFARRRWRKSSRRSYGIRDEKVVQIHRIARKWERRIASYRRAVLIGRLSQLSDATGSRGGLGGKRLWLVGDKMTIACERAM